MTESGYVWIVTEQALNANNTPDGVIGLQLVHAKSEKNHIRVSMKMYYTNNADWVRRWEITNLTSPLFTGGFVIHLHSYTARISNTMQSFKSTFKFNLHL